MLLVPFFKPGAFNDHHVPGSCRNYIERLEFLVDIFWIARPTQCDLVRHSISYVLEGKQPEGEALCLLYEAFGQFPTDIHIHDDFFKGQPLQSGIQGRSCEREQYGVWTARKLLRCATNCQLLQITQGRSVQVAQVI